MKKLSIIIPFLLLVASLSAAKYSGTSSVVQLNTLDVSNKVNSDCDPSSADVELNINNVRCTLLGAGDFWWNGVDAPAYEYPKIDPSSGVTPVHTIFSGALWFSALDDAGGLKVAGQTYRAGHDFWTGPLDQFGNVEQSICDDYDQFWEVSGTDIDAFLIAFEEAGGVNISASAIPSEILEWPGRGNPFYDGTSLYYNDGSLAPFYDHDGNGIYDPTKGDFPVIKAVCGGAPLQEYAHKMVFWVMNDMGNVHGRSNGSPLGVQINALAFAYSTSNELNDMTFYTYEIVKRTSGLLNETYMGIFVDPDLGDFSDDYIGCDTVRDIGYVYNSQSPDGDYGINIPVTAIDFFEGPLDDNGVELGLSSFVYFNNGACPDKCDPDTGPQFRNFQTGLWKDGDQITFGGDGSGGTIPTNYVYPSNPNLPAGATVWSECSENIAADDRRFLQNSGPFTLVSGQSQRITIGVMSVMVDNFQACPDIEAIIGPSDDVAQSLFDNCFGLLAGPDAPTLKIRELSNELLISLINEPKSNNFGETYEAFAVGANPALGQDTTYSFEGYIVYQLKDQTVSNQDLNDLTKAVPVYKADVKNGVSNVFNYVEDATTGLYIAQLMVEGSDQGISRSFRITDDKFATGDPTLINNKTYYYTAIAYAHNDYLPFYEGFPAVDSLGIPQITPYLQGIGNSKKYTAIPHSINGRNGGTVLNAEFGESVVVRRLEGQGNGGNEIALSQATEDAILASINSFEDVLEYQLGVDPIGLKIVDPLELKNVDFELLLKSYTEKYDTMVVGMDTTISSYYEIANTFSDSTVWELHVYNNSGQLIDTVYSERTIERPYDQYIDDYGISINVGNPTAIYTNADNNNAPVYDVISSSIAFTDIENEWLSFISDESSADQLASDWIRSGNIETNPNNVYDSYQYVNNPNSAFYDPNNVFAGLLDGNFAPYCLASNYADISPLADAPIYLHGPGFMADLYDPSTSSGVTDNTNTLDNLKSMDIVLTSDKSKWSKCIVFETGENRNGTIGGALKGQLRQSTSIDKDGNELAGTNGMSYFPGYAINKESGERLMIAFGESSERLDNNGGDMIWNPTAKDYDALGAQDPVFGGKHFIYVIDRVYTAQNVEALHAEMDAATYDFNSNVDPIVAAIYEEILYTSIPMLTSATTELASMTEGLIPNDVRISLNVETAYEPMTTTESTGLNNNNSMPRYGFSTDGLAPSEGVTDLAKEELNDIRVVPNPYYGYSSYEANQLDNLVKITNLPDECSVRVYSLDGKLVRELQRAVGNSGATSDTRQEISSGQVLSDDIRNLDNTVTWDLKNEKDILVGSGTYIILVSAPGIGEQVVKSAVFLRPADVNNF